MHTLGMLPEETRRRKVTLPDPQRSRHAVVQATPHGMVFSFSHGKVLHLQVKRLTPELLRTVEGRVYVQVTRGGAVLDSGYFEVDAALKTVTAREFKCCFQKILGKAVAAIAVGHLEDGDELLIVVHNEFYARARRMAAEGDRDIIYVEPSNR